MSNKNAMPKVEELKVALHSMVTKATPQTSKSQVAGLITDIEAAQEKGFTIEQIHTTLKEAGLDMTISTFKHNLHLVRKDRKSKF